MNSVSNQQLSRFSESVVALFEDRPPVLVEVRFPNSGTSPDWHLCEDQSELDAVLAMIGEIAEVYFSSVWDLENRNGAIRLTK